MNNSPIEIDEVGFRFSWSDRCYIVLAWNPNENRIMMYPLPLSYQGLRVPGYETGIEMLPGWHRRSFSENWSLMNVFRSGVITTPEAMDKWLNKPQNQRDLRDNIHQYYSATSNGILSYNGGNNWTMVPYH